MATADDRHLRPPQQTHIAKCIELGRPIGKRGELSRILRIAARYAPGAGSGEPAPSGLVIVHSP
jgi:hypothetical protein